MQTQQHEVTRLLGAWRHGDTKALDQLMPLVYGELKEIAARYFRRETPGHTLQPTAVVHEAFFRLMQQDGVEWQSRAHFMAVAAMMMRRVLIDYAKVSRAQRRGGGVNAVLLEDSMALSEDKTIDTLIVDEALAELEALDPEQAKVVELRFFGGLSVEETAEVTKLFTATVKRYWRSARAFLLQRLSANRSLPNNDTGTLETD